MIPWEVIDRANVPGQESDITLRKRGVEFSIRTSETELMNSRMHGSEERMAELAIQRLGRRPGLKILIGGLGMGYTLAAALEQSGTDSHIMVSELIPAIVRWNRDYLGHLSGMPLNDPRVTIATEDVAKTADEKKTFWDAILLDVDNGPEGLTRKANDRLYSTAGLKSFFSALRSGGVLSVWSCRPDEAFTRRLILCGFKTRAVTVRARKSGKGSRHTIWVAEKP